MEAGHSFARSAVTHGSLELEASGSVQEQAPAAVDEVLAPWEKLSMAQAVLERNELRKQMLENDHLQSLGRQIMSTRRTEPHTQFGYRQTQERKNGRITWEDAKTWKYADPAAKLPGPTDYDPNLDLNYRVPGEGGVVNGEVRFVDDRPRPAKPWPTTRADLKDGAMTVRPDVIKETIAYKRRPVYLFGAPVVKVHGPSGAAAATKSEAGGASPVKSEKSGKAVAAKTMQKTNTRLPTFRDLRDEIPVSSVMDYYRKLGST